MSADFPRPAITFFDSDLNFRLTSLNMTIRLCPIFFKLLRDGPKRGGHTHLSLIINTTLIFKKGSEGVSNVYWSKSPLFRYLKVENFFEIIFNFNRYHLLSFVILLNFHSF